MNDLERVMEYAEQIPAFSEKHGGKCIIQGVVSEKMEAIYSALRFTPDQWQKLLYGQDAIVARYNERHKNRSFAMEGGV